MNKLSAICLSVTMGVGLSYLVNTQIEKKTHIVPLYYSEVSKSVNVDEYVLFNKFSLVPSVLNPVNAYIENSERKYSRDNDGILEENLKLKDNEGILLKAIALSLVDNIKCINDKNIMLKNYAQMQQAVLDFYDVFLYYKTQLDSKNLTIEILKQLNKPREPTLLPCNSTYSSRS